MIYIKAKSIEDAFKLFTTNKNAKYIAGGTDIMANRFLGIAKNEDDCLIDISEIKELKEYKIQDDKLYLGSLLTLQEIACIKEIKKHTNILLDAVNSVASPVIRQSATIGGNILCENRCIFFNQTEWWREAIGLCLKCGGDICIATGGKKACFSKFVSDTVPALIVLNASIEIFSKNTFEIIPLKEIYTGDGIRPHKLTNGELLCRIIININQTNKYFFFKLRQRKSLEFTSLTIAAAYNYDNIKIALSGVDPAPVFIDEKRGKDKEEIIKFLLKKSRTVNNDMFSRNYRRDMIKYYAGNIIDKWYAMSDI